MKIVFKIYNIVFALVVCWNFAFSAGGEVSGAAYLKLGMDAKGIALGRAYTAISSGASSIYWNPAGLLNPEVGYCKFDMQTTYKTKTDWDDSYITTALAWRTKRLALGIGYIHYGVTDIPEYDGDMNYYGDFNNIEEAGLIGVAFDFPGLFQIGITNIILTQTYSGLNRFETDGSLRYGWGINMGLKFKPVINYERFEIGIMLNDKKISGLRDIKNIFSDNSDEVRETTSLFMNVGLKWVFWQRPADIYFNSITLLSDAEQEEDFPIKLKIGTEVQVINLRSTNLFIRGGIDDWILEIRDLAKYPTASRKDLKNQIIRLNRKFTLGIGLQYEWLIVDYAWVKESFRNLHFVTMKLAF